MHIYTHTHIYIYNLYTVLYSHTHIYTWSKKYPSSPTIVGSNGAPSAVRRLRERTKTKELRINSRRKEEQGAYTCDTGGVGSG